MTKYAVVSREVEGTIPILDNGTDPSEFWCEYAEVEAYTPKMAKIRAVRKWRAEGKIGYPGYCDYDQNPFTGLKVYDLDAMELEWIAFECLIIDLCRVLLAKVGEA